MFLHLGGDVSVLHQDIIGIFDTTAAMKSGHTREFLDLARGDKAVVYIASEDKVKSFIVTEEKVFFSPISSTTLCKRANDKLAIIAEE